MEFTQENIDALVVNEVEIMKKIAEELNIRVQQVSAVISLVEEGCTIPFISRYRKEKHDNLDEVQVRDCDHLYKSYHNLEDRRLEIVKGVFAQGKLTETLYNAIMSATTNGTKSSNIASSILKSGAKIHSFLYFFKICNTITPSI